MRALDTLTALSLFSVHIKIFVSYIGYIVTCSCKLSSCDDRDYHCISLTPCGLCLCQVAWCFTVFGTWEYQTTLGRPLPIPKGGATIIIGGGQCPPNTHECGGQGVQNSSSSSSSRVASTTRVRSTKRRHQSPEWTILSHSYRLIQ